VTINREICGDFYELVQMIIKEDPDRPFEYTAKLSLRRGAVVARYEEDIDAIYEAFNNASTGFTNKKAFKTLQSLEDTLHYVRDTVLANVGIQVENDDDIFLAGGADR
jgi:hypothetical protein